MAVGSAGLADELMVAAPCRTCTSGHSKFNGSASPAAALALVPLGPNNDENDGIDSEDDEQSARSEHSRATAAMRPRRAIENSDTPHPDMPTHRSVMAKSR